MASKHNHPVPWDMAESIVRKNCFEIMISSVDNQTVEANGSKWFYIDIQKDGYTALALTGFYIQQATSSGTGNTAQRVYAARLNTDRTEAQIAVKNSNTSSAAKIKVNAYVLYVKD